MEELDKQRSTIEASDPQAAAGLLKSMTQEIENLRQTLLSHLSQDVERLQREKFQLIEDIEKLQAQRQQEIVQQQKLIGQLAPALANQLQELLTQHLNQLIDSPPVLDEDATLPLEVPKLQSPKREALAQQGTSAAKPSPTPSKKVSSRENRKGRQSHLEPIADSELPPTSTASDYNENAHRLIASLDATLRATFRTLQQDLSSYQSSLSQQLGQMYSLEQQGEALLETLVNRLKKELQSESSNIERPPEEVSSVVPKPTPLPHHEALGYLENNHKASPISYPPKPSVPEVQTLPESEPPDAILQSSPQSLPASKLQLGFLLVLFSALVVSFQNVVISVIFNKSPIFGLFELGGFIFPSVGNSLLLLWLRMLVVVPIMAILTTVLYPGMWKDIKQFAQSKDWLLFLNVLGSGFFLFLSQVLIYLALGTISPGVAITIFFIYPIVTVLLAWVLFSDRASLLRGFVIFSVLAGFVLLTFPTNRADDLSELGVSAAAGSGITFAFYVILAQSCAKKLNPIPLSWINFVMLLAFSGLSLAGPLPQSWGFNIASTLWPYLFISSLVLGCTTFVSYLLDNISIKMISAHRASMLGATVPMLTALLAWAIVQKALQVQQLFGMLLVSLGVAILSFERWHRPSQTTQPAVRKLK
jgi:drug/metabolite transporter (DMT)-like permease